MKEMRHMIFKNDVLWLKAFTMRLMGQPYFLAHLEFSNLVYEVEVHALSGGEVEIIAIDLLPKDAFEPNFLDELIEHSLQKHFTLRKGADHNEVHWRSRQQEAQHQSG